MLFPNPGIFISIKISKVMLLLVNSYLYQWKKSTVHFSPYTPHKGWVRCNLPETLPSGCTNAKLSEPGYVFGRYATSIILWCFYIVHWEFIFIISSFTDFTNSQFSQFIVMVYSLNQLLKSDINFDLIIHEVLPYVFFCISHSELYKKYIWDAP